jgi:3-hydroxyacyl-CoA dehydrogenase
MERSTLETLPKTLSNKKMSRRIKKVAVLGSGVMGAGIAAHFANIGLDVLMLDIIPFNLSDEEKKDPVKRNSIVNGAMKALLKSKPAALYQKGFAKRIQVGNFDDDMEKIADVDWVIEVVIERLDIKQQVFANVEKHRKAGALVTSNTSSIPIHLMTEGRSDDFKKNFCGTHFFNPPRYLKLFEVIPTPDTDKEVVDFLMNYGDVYLGKRTVLCKDTPAFIANRVGVYAMAKIFQLTTELDMTIEEVDKVTGTPMGRPRTGVFRLGDLVGHDTSGKVIETIRTRCENDEQVGAFEIPKYIDFLLENKFFGDKSGQGFYKKTKEKDDKGRKIILALDLEKLEYRPKQKVNIPSLEAVKQIDGLAGRIRTFFKHDDKAAQLVQKSLGGLFAYVSNRIPEISDNLFSIDDALRAGFAWDVGPFQYWDMIGAKAGIAAAEKEGEVVAQWVHDMVAAGNDTFYKLEKGVNHYYCKEAKAYLPVPGADQFIILDNLRATKKLVYENPEAVAHDIGDGVLCLEFRSKMNSIGEGVLRGINDVIDLAEKDGWKGIVIGNNAEQFSVGANLMAIAMMAYQQEFDELNFAVNTFQQTTMRCRYSSIPVVAATQGYVFGGGCEVMMHCDAAVCATESYIGLVEVGVGLIPGGGGTKEFALRASDGFVVGDVQIPTLIEKFKTIAMASVATSAHEAYGLGYLTDKDSVSVNTARNIGEAKKKVLSLAGNYSQPGVRKNIDVLGRTGLGALYAASHSLKLGKYASEHDIKIANKVAFVLCGGDLTGPQQVSEQYLLDIEREAFLSLCGEQKTLERIQHMLQTNKPLRN